MNLTVFILIIAILARNGVNFWGYDRYAIAWSKVWPKPVSVFSVENSGNLILAKLFNVDTRLGWMALHILLTILVALIIVIFISLQEITSEQKRSLFFLLAASQIGVMLSQEIGYFDVITILGATLLGFAQNNSLRLLGAFVMCLGNTPQALVATCLFGALVIVLKSKKRISSVAFFYPAFLAAIIWLLQRLWLSESGRASEFGPSMWLYSFKGFLVSPSLFLYSLLGSLWLLSPLFWQALTICGKKKALLVVLLVLVIPGIFGVVTTESSRDALLIMSPSFIYLMRYLVSERGLILNKGQMIAISLFPAFLIWREGAVVEPWSVLHRLFF
jgi:hypothetical protein